MSAALIILVVLLVIIIGGAVAFFGRRSQPLESRFEEGIRDGELKEAASELEQKSVQDELDIPDTTPHEPEPALLTRPSFRDRLTKARGAVSGYFGNVLSRGKIDAQTWEELEEALIGADVGVATTMAMLERTQTRVKGEGIKEAADMMDVLKEEMIVEASGHDISLSYGGNPSIWMFVGVNGVGKTTTIGKLAKREVTDGRKLVLGAGDTFRAAAAEQLQTWAERAETGFIRGSEGADPGSVIFDAVEHASSEGADLVLADTAGRLHNKTNLMEELRKVRRVAEKGAGKVTEVLLVIDATTGQNGLVQAKTFTEAVDVTGVVLTKLDGSAKGGIVLAIQSELGIPVKLVGLGEGIGDLVEFDPTEFVEALFAN